MRKSDRNKLIVVLFIAALFIGSQGSSQLLSLVDNVNFTTTNALVEKAVTIGCACTNPMNPDCTRSPMGYEPCPKFVTLGNLQTTKVTVYGICGYVISGGSCTVLSTFGSCGCTSSTYAPYTLCDVTCYGNFSNGTAVGTSVILNNADGYTSATFYYLDSVMSPPIVANPPSGFSSVISQFLDRVNDALALLKALFGV